MAPALIGAALLGATPGLVGDRWSCDLPKIYVGFRIMKRVTTKFFVNGYCSVTCPPSAGVSRLLLGAQFTRPLRRRIDSRQHRRPNPMLLERAQPGGGGAARRGNTSTQDLG